MIKTVFEHTIQPEIMKHALDEEDLPLPGPKSNVSPQGPPVNREKKTKMRCAHQQIPTVSLKLDEPDCCFRQQKFQSYNNNFVIGSPDPPPKASNKTAGGIFFNNNLNGTNILPSHNSGSMFPPWWPFRKHRKRFLICVVACVCFILGVTLPMIIKCFKDSNSFERDFAPLANSYSNERVLSPNDSSVLKDLFISVKTTKKFHHPRLVILLETWVNLVKSQTWFFSDAKDEDLQSRAGDHLVVTDCADTHSRTALACKMASEFDTFLKSHKSWWCHFDDDNYVHVTRLARLLSSYPASQPWYLGKPSTARPLEIFDSRAPKNTSQFWFATGGAGFCISRTLALKMAPFAANGKFVETGDQFWFPDDVTLGYIIEHLLGEQLTVVSEFHSHLEPMGRISESELDSQISFSYINYDGIANALSLDGPFSVEVDPTRFYSLHCRLYSAPYCPEKLSS